MELHLILPSLSLSYIKDEWVTIFNPNDRSRLYLHIKYVFSLVQTENSSSNPQESFIESFDNALIDSDQYLQVFSFHNIERRGSFSYNSKISSPHERKTVRVTKTKSLRLALGVVFACFLFVWCFTVHFPTGLRIWFVSIVSPILLFLYPF